MVLPVKQRLILALTVFSMFFGAGNLIFPPFLAIESGDGFIPALLGFCITAIGLPIMALLSVERSDGLDRLSGRIHPLFGMIYTVMIYLAIGPCLAIPRTASTSYEMLKAATGFSGPIPSIIYSFIFFSVSAFVSLRPEKLTKTLGRITCPLLIALIAVLTAGALASGFGDAVPEASGSYATSPFAAGFNDGYQTMDAIAAFVFGMVVAMNIKDMGISGRKELQRTEAMAGAGAALLFILAYSAIAITGRIAGSLGCRAGNGAEILSFIAGETFGKAGMIMLSLIFIAACFNSCTGLIASCAEYFSRLIPAISGRSWSFIFAFISFVISSIGLNQIISISVPVLSLLYPVAILLILLGFIPDGERYRWLHRLSVSTALAVSLFSMILPRQMSFLPLSDASLPWMLPSLAAGIIGYIADRRLIKRQVS